MLVETLDGSIAEVSFCWDGCKLYMRGYFDEVEGYKELSTERKKTIWKIIEAARQVPIKDQEIVFGHLFEVAGDDFDIAVQCFEATEKMMN